jgi:hypothetical protein
MERRLETIPPWAWLRIRTPMLARLIVRVWRWAPSRVACVLRPLPRSSSSQSAVAGTCKRSWTRTSKSQMPRECCRRTQMAHTRSTTPLPPFPTRTHTGPGPRHRLCPRSSVSGSMPSPPSLSRTTAWSSSETPTRVRGSLSPRAFPRTQTLTPASSIYQGIHPDQEGRRRLLRHRRALRLAWAATPEYTAVCHAAQRGRPTRIRRPALGGCQAHEEAMVRLARVRKPEGTPGNGSAVMFAHKGR